MRALPSATMPAAAAEMPGGTSFFSCYMRSSFTCNQDRKTGRPNNTELLVMLVIQPLETTRKVCEKQEHDDVAVLLCALSATSSSVIGLLATSQPIESFIDPRGIVDRYPRTGTECRPVHIIGTTTCTIDYCTRPFIHNTTSCTPSKMPTAPQLIVLPPPGAVLDLWSRTV